MLEGLAAWVLNNYLGKYVENLNTDQLSIALLSGEVELENLPLKKDALRHLGLPVQIKAGFIGKVKLQIPVRQIKSMPWVILIEQLYLVATPLPVLEWDAVSEEIAAQELKLSALDNLEARWRLELESKDNNSTYYASTYSSWLSYGTGFISDIIENLQLKIKDVHIRYEDNFSISNKPVAFGISIESLSAQSSDSFWKPGFSHVEGSDCSYKLLDMQKLAVYWTEVLDTQLLSKMTLSELAAAMSPSQNILNDKSYILSPVSAQAHIKRNRSEHPLRSMDQPRIACDLQLEEVPLKLVDWQYDQMVQCLRGLEDVARYRAYRRYRPICSIKEDARAWWLYAICCHYPDRLPAICKPKPTWETCLTRANENVQYVKMYTKILITPSMTLSAEDKKLKELVEWHRDFEELKVLRELAMKSVPRQSYEASNGNSAGRSMLVRWFPTWMGWYSSTSQENVSSNAAETANQLEGEILRALTDSAENNTILKRDMVFGQFSFTLKSGNFRLCTAQNNATKGESVPMIELQFKNLCLNIVSRPRSSSHLVELSLGALYLKDKFTMNSLFPILIGPPGQDRSCPPGRSRGPSPRVSVVTREDSTDHLFYMAYEKKPESGCDYRLCIKTKSLDVVYQPSAVRWLTEFLCLPHKRSITQSQIQAMKSRTKKELIKNWEQILDGRTAVRKSWELQLDITAPQIFFVENFTESSSAMAVIDFGRLQLRNNLEKIDDSICNGNLISKESEDDEMFMTPCSTPPASEESDSDLTVQTATTNPLTSDDLLTEKSLHQKLYDRYYVELTDMQILIGKVKDNWRYAHNKGTSTLHVLDRFNISLMIERRVIHTSDPLYPSLTLNANLPKLVAHVNEYKIASARTLANIITATGLPSPFASPPEVKIEDNIDAMNMNDDETFSMDTSIEMSRLLTLQFSVDHLALEVQSRGRSVAELQVTGVKMAFTKRPVDTSVTLTVHGLLLVDALQTFGPDFELLVASHKHVGMDSMSGSLRDSEPTSPTSPASPDPNIVNRSRTTSPIALKQALSSLASSPPIQQFGHGFRNRRGAPILDAEALISIEVVIINGIEPIQIANIQFNNLDIIANQETIVELIGFSRRVFPDLKSQKPNVNLSPLHRVSPTSPSNEEENIEEPSFTPKLGTTELSFDFHRLNVLLLRGVVKDGCVVGKKICTATMSEAKIQATVDSSIVIEGSLGGLQLLDLTPEGHMHQRIVSVGRDPLLENTHPLYIMSSSLVEEENKAFSFKVLRQLETTEETDSAEVTVRMASLWYTHSPQFIMELQSCATEFKQYLSNLAKSIRSAATDMALGLVHAKAEAIAQSLYMNSRLSSSIYGSAFSFADISSPRRRRRSSSMDQSVSGYSSVRDTIPQTPYSPADNNFIINLKLDLVLDSPVVVLPRSSNSYQVFVAHLGKISASNKQITDNSTSSNIQESTRCEHYSIEVKDMNLFSLDTASRRVPGPLMSRPEILYSCETLAKPILHDTVLQLSIIREISCPLPSRQQSYANLLIDDEDEEEDDYNLEEAYKFGNETIQVSGSVVNSLRVSLTRSQYEHLLDTIQWLTTIKKSPEQSVRISHRTATTLSDIKEEDTGVTTLNMDPHVRAKLFSNVGLSKQDTEKKKSVAIKVAFDLPVFTLELRGDSPTGEQGLVDLSFRDFTFVYDKGHQYETNIQVSLRSIFMEDLLQPEGSKQRAMVVSSSGEELPMSSNCVSRSCPDMIGYQHRNNLSVGSLPDHLEPCRILGADISNTNSNAIKTNNENVFCPCTPPPSPSARNRPQKNLVIISTLLVDPKAPNFKSYYNSIQRSTSVDFNCLDLVVSVESWVVVLDFFSASPSDTVDGQSNNKETPIEAVYQDKLHTENAETNITVRSLTMVLVRPDRDVARANISNVEISVKTCGLTKEVEGKLGSISLSDLTKHGQLYRERFLTSGKHALLFNYKRHAPNELLDYDCQLKLKMSQVIYVHTKRFIIEIQSFFNHFSQLQAVMSSIRAATSGQKLDVDTVSKVSIVLEAGAPVLMLPVSSKSSKLLIADLGELRVTNSFKYSGDPTTISVVSNTSGTKCLLDVMLINLDNVNIYTGVRESDHHNNNPEKCYKLGSCFVRKQEPSILTDKCHLILQVERNLNRNNCHNVPDMSIHGQLSTLEGSIDVTQYCLIKGLLSYNLGEDTEHIFPSVLPPPITAEPNIREVWTLSSLRLDLLNVRVKLHVDKAMPPLSCINFIKSRLMVDSFSNLSQDIDLVSQEILILDTRFESLPKNERSNVFTNILQPIKPSEQKDLVQAEIHSRKRLDKIKFTILLNNMRLMGVFDWWEAARDFILSDGDEQPTSPNHQKLISSDKQKDNVPFELKLNITDSEIVVVENTSQWDTNAVILKSTTVVTYRPAIVEKPLSCNLNNCEMFSCILGMEDETALSIIDPVTLNMEINKEHTLEFQLQLLTVRLSYYDMKMFMQILNSLPKQLLSKNESENSTKNSTLSKQSDAMNLQISKLTALGFKSTDCVKALEICEMKLDDAALWLTQNAVPHNKAVQNEEEVIGPLTLFAVELKANCISVCIIDDCGDVDVPLLELSLSNLNMRQGLRPILLNDTGKQGALECSFASDYYNRVLSGWEPIIEPWNCKIMWNSCSSSNLSKVNIQSNEVLNFNITSTLTELYKQVKDSWMQDYYSIKEASAKNANSNSSSSASTSSQGIRRRSPFIPFALKNDTGSTLLYTTFITDNKDDVNPLQVDSRWISVPPGKTVPFSFKAHNKIRHCDSHKMRRHQICVQVEGYDVVNPVTVDKVGIYFRHTSRIQQRKMAELPPARIVFEVALEGTARKLVTVRSAFQITNKLIDAVSLKLESQLKLENPKTFFLETNKTLAVPLVHAHSLVSVKPANSRQMYLYSSPISWEDVSQPNKIKHVLRACNTNREQLYRFCAEIKRENYPTDKPSALVGVIGEWPQPGHTITILPTVLLENLLPMDLSYKINDFSGSILPGNEASLTNVDPEETLEMTIKFENFLTSSTLVIPSNCTTPFTYRVRLEDSKNRKLYLSALISPHTDSKIKISISAPYWIINKTGLPIVFKQGGTSTECAGQFKEHEEARIMTPFLFSLSDLDASPTIVARVGNNVMQDGKPQWCQNFHLQRGQQVKRLRVALRDGRPDVVFIVGIEVRPGRGKYRATNIVTISPRYQLHNKSSYKLLFSQKCFTTTNNPRNSSFYMKAMPDCQMPFHWPRLDKDQLLCVLIEDIPDCCWSGGLLIDSNYSTHVNLRDVNGRMYFLRLEVVLQGATFFVVFTDADTMPPPIRIDNFSEVSISFAQTDCKDIPHCLSKARAHASVPYAWDELTGKYSITIIAPGGISNSYDINSIGTYRGPTYENFIYIAFTGTFKNSRDPKDMLDVENQELVLDVVNGNNVILARKQQGQRSQLWRMTPTGQLQHEGSSPPSYPQQPRHSTNILVLDIEGPAPQPSCYTRLMLRRPDPRRQSTQTWRFTEDGRLCCMHKNMCVQAQDGFFGVRQGSYAVLGLPQPVCHRKTDEGIPLEQAVTRQRLRPGSGFLCVEINTDGPTRVLSIRDEKEYIGFTVPDEKDWTNISVKQSYSSESSEAIKDNELQITLNISGIGISLVSRLPPQELLFAQFSHIVGEMVLAPSSKKFCISVGEVQIDNQLFEAPIPVVLYVTPPGSRGADEAQSKLPAIEFRAEMLPVRNENAIIFKYLILKLKKITLHLEERLLLKFFQFIGFNSKEEELMIDDKSDYETQRMITEVSGAHAKRYYFGVIQLIPDQIKLSMKTASKLPSQLQAIKRKLGFTFIKFEDAAVDLEPFMKEHPFETMQFMFQCVMKHFKDELLWQAGIILGSVDFLGNPLGFMNDVSEGVSGLIREGNVGALVKNVTHGLSNSAAKVTESLSDGLGRVTMDDEHEEMRQRIRQVDTGRGRDHLMAGFKGLGFGLLGGATGIFKQVYEGATNEGIQGVFSGIGKGLVGAVTKPVVGVLDLASETARAVRDSSRNRLVPDRIRLSRCVFGPGGLLPRYSLKQAYGQQYLYIVNDRNYEEELVSYEILRSGSDDLRVIVSNQWIRIVTNSGGHNFTTVIECQLCELEKCQHIIKQEGSGNRYYIEITMHVYGSNSDMPYHEPIKKPIVRCDSLEVAKAVSQHINYAKSLFIERLLTLTTDNMSQTED